LTIGWGGVEYKYIIKKEKKMKKNFKWLINVATICLCLCAIAIGVYAAKQASLTATGTIGFTATNVYAEVSGQTSGAAEEVTFNTITIDSTKTGNPYTDTSTWSGKDINFDEEGTPITLTFTITNLSTGRPLYAKVTNTSSATNLSVEVNEIDFTETDWLTIPVKTEGSTANTTTIVISLSVADDNESVTGNYGFNIQLQSTEPVVEEEVLDASTYTNLTFSVLDANAKTLSVAANGSPSGDLVIPNKVIFNDQQYIITCIKDNGFYDCWDITSVSLPNSLTSIGNYAFGSCIFTSIIIPSSVVSMGNGIFDNSSLKTLIISSGVTTIGESAFLNTYSLTSVTIHSSVISIGSGAFASCNKLSTVNYTGTEEQWASITIESGNDPLTNATKVYNYQG